MKHNQIKKDRLIARMILGIGLSLSVASAVACGITHPKFSNIADEYWKIKEAKDAYLDAYENTDEFKTTYNAVVAELNDRLIAREIDGNTYDKGLEKLDTNEFTEQVITTKADEQTKAEFNEINQKYLDAETNWNKSAIPAYLTAIGPVALPAFTYLNYYLLKPTKKEELEEEHTHQINPEIMKKVMEMTTTYYAYDHSHRINAEETKQYSSAVLDAIKNQPNTAMPSENQICKDMLKNVTHNDDTPHNCGYPINEKETQENENTL